MKCPLCGLVFGELNGRAACAGCVVSKKCGLIRCPNCGYEMAPETKRKRKPMIKDRTDDAINR